jgi:hypothetical protein
LWERDVDKRYYEPDLGNEEEYCTRNHHDALPRASGKHVQADHFRIIRDLPHIGTLDADWHAAS